MKYVLACALVVLMWIQYGLWFGQSGYFARERMENRLTDQERRVELLQQRNKILTAEVMALKEDNRVLESRARRDLGLVKRGEVFYLIPQSEL